MILDLKRAILLLIGFGNFYHILSILCTCALSLITIFGLIMAEMGECTLIDESEVKRFIDSNNAVITVRKTKSDLNIWTKWCNSIGEMRPVQDIPPKEISIPGTYGKSLRKHFLLAFNSRPQISNIILAGLAHYVFCVEKIVMFSLTLEWTQEQKYFIYKHYQGDIQFDSCICKAHLLETKWNMCTPQYVPKWTSTPIIAIRIGWLRL